VTDNSLERRLRELRRKVYRETATATWNRIVDLDFTRPYVELTETLRQSEGGLLCAGTAQLLCRAFIDAGYNAWCYEFGFEDIFTSAVTVVDANGQLRVHDAFLNSSYPVDFFELLDSLRLGQHVRANVEGRDRKCYIADPAFESESMLRWLTASADQEIGAPDGLRRFEVLWNMVAFSARNPDIDKACDELERRGFPSSLPYLMLHPLSVFDGTRHHHERAAMPLIGNRDLRSEIAQQKVEIARQKAEIAQRKAEVADTRVRLADADERIHHAENQVAQLHAEIADAEAEWQAQRRVLEMALDALGEQFKNTLGRVAAAEALRQRAIVENAALITENSRLATENAERDQRITALCTERRELGERVEGWCKAVLTPDGTGSGEIPEVLEMARRRIRSIERALDLEEVTRATLGGRLEGWEKSWYGRLCHSIGKLRRRGSPARMMGPPRPASPNLPG
jgi:hypothetical protein